MLKIKQYVKAESLEQAYELNQKKTNRIVGGMLWLKMSTAQIQTAIDLSGLGLDQIEESEEEFSIGCMVTLRQLEEHEGLNAYTDGAARECAEYCRGAVPESGYGGRQYFRQIWIFGCADAVSGAGYGGGAGSCGTDAAGGVCLFKERQGCAGKADCEEA